MTNLEFIEKLINDIDTAIRLRKIDVKMYEALDDAEEIESNQYALNQLEDYMQHFQQIKLELEAWEVIKQDFILSWESPNNASGYYLKYFGDIEYEILKKVLGVKEC